MTALRDQLSRSLPEVVKSDAPADRLAYARDLWPRRHLDVRGGRGALVSQPGCIVWPRTAEEVSQVVKRCAEEGIPVVPFGAGSGVSGGILPSDKMVVLDLKGMNRERRLRSDEPSLDVEAGALGITLEENLQARGYTIGHFPSSILCSTVGGWLAARGAGQCSGKYGKIEDMVSQLELVDGRGEIMTLRRRLGGPDLTPLVIGSEGTLGVITSATLRLHKNPTSRSYLSFSFPSIEAGWTCIRDLFQAGLRPAVARLYDPFDSFLAKQGSVKKEKTHRPGSGSKVLARVLRAPRLLNGLIDSLGSKTFGGAMLVLIFEGEGPETDHDAARACVIAEHHAGRAHGDGPARKWMQHRYSVSYRQAPVFRMGAFSDTMEVAAPWSRLSALYNGVRKAIGAYGFVMAHLSHAYPDGCSIYFTFAASSEDDTKAAEKYDALWAHALTACVEAGGTISHHHGVGRSKAPRVPSELGCGVTLLRQAMAAFDPSGIMNPGSLLGPHDPKLPIAKPPVTTRGFAIDTASLLATLPGDMTVVEAQTRLRAHGFALAADATGARSVATWIGDGMPGQGDAWADPVSSRISGLVATLAGGETMDLAPAPRRAVGPDLTALFIGTQGRAGHIESATLPIARVDSEPARALAYDGPRDPAPSSAERSMMSRILGS